MKLEDLISWKYPDNMRVRPSVWGWMEEASWTLEVTDAPGAWLLPQTADAYVAVIDSGLDTGHRDLAGVRLTGSGAAAGDSDGHGTAVTGIVAARHGAAFGMAGVCPGVGIAVYVAGDKTGDWFLSSVYDWRTARIVAQLEQLHKDATAAQAPLIRALTLSKGGKVTGAVAFTTSHYLAPIEQLLKDGIVVVLAPANAGVLAADCVPAAIRSLLTTYPHLLIVSASNPPAMGLWERNADPVYVGQTDVDVWAPGGAQVTLGIGKPAAYNEISTKSSDLNVGNSLAIPHVAGLAALLFRINGALTAAQVGTIIRETTEEQVYSPTPSGMRVVNAFAAALRAHNAAVGGEPLAGYRIMIPHQVDFATGREELAGAELELTARTVPGKVRIPFAYVKKAGRSQAFCRFTAPASLWLDARLLVPRKKTVVCLWSGRLNEVVAAACPESANAVWTHPACPHLHTVRLQGLALSLVYSDDKSRPVIGANVVLKSVKTGREWQCTTANDGSFLVPFVDPGQHTLTVTDIPDGPEKFERTLDLDQGGLYVADPPAGTLPYIAIPKPTGGWLQNWVGDVEYAGNASVWRRRLDNWPLSLSSGDLFQVSGALQFSASTKPLTKKAVLTRCFEEISGESDMSLKEFEADYGPFPDDQMPDLSRAKVRLFSEALAKLTGKTMTEEQQDWMQEVRENSVLDWKEADSPAGWIVAEGSGGLTYSMDIAALTRQVLRAHFANPEEGAFQLPCGLDFSVGWFLDFQQYGSADETTAYELQIAWEEWRVAPALFCCYADWVDEATRRCRVIAGPIEGPVEFVAAPQTVLRLLPDPEPCPPGCVSVILEEPEGEHPGIATEMYVLGPRGELGVVSRWRPAAVGGGVPSHILVEVLPGTEATV